MAQNANQIINGAKTENSSADSHAAQSPENIRTNDRRLCGNPLVFRNISCAWLNNDRLIVSYGWRCSGALLVLLALLALSKLLALSCVILESS